MSRRYRDQIRVWQGPQQAMGAVPVRFRWRRRTYVITEILGRWIEAGSWWAGAGAALRTETGVAPERPQTERLVWRVEARTTGRTGVFDLCETDARSDAPWLLLAAVD